MSASPHLTYSFKGFARSALSSALRGSAVFGKAIGGYMFWLKTLPKGWLKTVACCIVAFVFHLAPALDLSVLLADGGPSIASSRTSVSHKAVSVRTPKDKLPLYFIENRGQTDSRVAYYVQGANKVFYFTDEGITLVLSQQRSARADLVPVS